MKVLRHDAGDWRVLEPDDDRLRTTLAEGLGAENLIVLCGVGSTLYLNRDRKEIAPTMAGLWETVQQSWEDEASTHSPNTTFEDILKEVRHAPEAKDIEGLLSRCLLRQDFDASPIVERFVTHAQSKIVERCRFAEGDSIELDVHRMFLRKIAARSVQLPRTKVFTTNYDTSIERAARDIEFVVVDGFSHSAPQRFHDDSYTYDFVRREPGKEPSFIPNVFQLFKLHGSVDWCSTFEDGVERRAETSHPLIIYPRSSKYASSYQFPFLRQMSRFQIALRQPNTCLLVVGFGFRDGHLNGPMLSAIESNVGLRVFVVSPSLESDATEHEVLRKTSTFIRGGDRRLTLLAGTFEEFVRILPDLSAESDDSEHRKRVGHP